MVMLSSPATVAVLFENIDLPQVKEYIHNTNYQMHKVVLEANDADHIIELSKRLTINQVIHKLWV